MDTFAHRRGLLITIDGPAGAGKSTTARALASRLGYAYLDTGALYRAVAWVVRRADIDCADVEAMKTLLSSTDFHVSLDEGVTRTFIDDEEITGYLRSPGISRLASAVAALPYVRDRLLPIQARYSRDGGIVAEGRDMGTRVFPEADVKFFLEADLETRTSRRHQETVRDGHPETQRDVRLAIEERDANDRSRETAPLKPAADAVVIDSSSLTVEQVVERMLAWIPGHS